MEGLDDVEYATLEWVDWFNDRLLEPIAHVPPAEFEAAYWSKEGSEGNCETQRIEPPVNPARFIPSGLSTVT